MSHKRRKKDYDYFNKRVNRWRDYFGLFDWSIVTRFEDIGPNRAAEIDRNTAGRFSSIILNNRGIVQADEENEYRLCKTAFHEIMHLILAELAEAARDGVGWMRAEPMEEAAVRRFENVVHDDILRMWELKRENEELRAELAKLKKKKNKNKDDCR